MNYMKTWFPIDLISMVPFDAIGLAIDTNRESGRLKIVKVVRLLRLVKLVRMVRASRLLKRFELSMPISYRQLALLQFFIMLCIMTHWLANLWALSLVLVDEDEMIPRWVDAFDEMEVNVDEKTKDTTWKLYIASVYFTSYTLTSIGYGDIGPVNIVERIVCTMMIVISGVSWAVVLGQVCGILSSMNTDERAFRTDMDEINIMMTFRSFPSRMRARVRAFMLSSKRAQAVKRHQDILRSLSPGLRGEVALLINRHWIEKVSFFKEFMNAAAVPIVIVETCLAIEVELYAQSEEFGVPQTLYIMHRGLASHGGKLHRQGAVWGMDFVLSDPDLIQPCDAFALTYVEVAALEREKFMDVLDTYRELCPDLAQHVRRFICWLAFQRAMKAEAYRRRKRTRMARKHTCMMISEEADQPEFLKGRRNMVAQQSPN